MDFGYTRKKIVNDLKVCVKESFKWKIKEKSGE